MEQKYSAFVRFADGTTVMVLPGHVTREEAEEQSSKMCSVMAQFPGGTQSILAWIEPV